MTMQLQVPSMACEVCAQTITKAVNAIDAQAKVEADLQTKQVTIETQAAAAAVRAAIAAAGYPVS